MLFVFSLQNVRKSEACRLGEVEISTRKTFPSSPRIHHNLVLERLTCPFGKAVKRVPQADDMSTDFKARYVSVIHFVFHIFLMISNFYRVWFVTIVVMFAFCKYTMKHLQKLDWKSDFPWFSYGRWKHMNVGFLTEHIGSLHCVQSWACRIVLQFEDVVLSFLWHVCLWCLFLDRQ